MLDASQLLIRIQYYCVIDNNNISDNFSILKEPFVINYSKKKCKDKRVLSNNISKQII